jgi:intraflagellar transport protein 74
MSNRPGTGGGWGIQAGAARLSTAQRQANFQGVGLNTEVKVGNRPVTGQGMTGIRIKTAGPGRQVQDTSYFLGLLRTKNQELQDEIASFEREIKQHNSDSTRYAQMERRYEGLIKEVRSLEGQLADYNLAMDKFRTNTDPFEIARYQQTLKERNQTHAAEVDRVFVRRREQEDRARQLRDKIEEHRAGLAARVEELGPDQRGRWQRLSQERRELGQRIGRMDAEIQQVAERAQAAEKEIKTNSWRNEHDAALRTLKRLRREREVLTEEAEAMLLDPAEARERLLARVKRTTAAIRAAEERIEAVEDGNEQARRHLQELTTDIEERRGESNESHKYEVLFQRDREMTEFIESFEGVRDKEIAQQKEAQNMVVALLEHISRDLNRRHNMPSAQHLEQMKEDLSFKKRQVDASQSTHLRLRQELQKREGELEKINGLDAKISVELKSLGEKIEVMQEEMKSFDDLEGLREQADATRGRLVQLARAYKKRRDCVRGQVSILSATFERAKEQLAGSETGKALDAQEQRLRHYEQNLFKLTEFIETKGRETDYRPLKDECKQQMGELNALLVSKAGDAKVVLQSEQKFNPSGY